MGCFVNRKVLEGSDRDLIEALSLHLRGGTEKTRYRYGNPLDTKSVNWALVGESTPLRHQRSDSTGAAAESF